MELENRKSLKIAPKVHVNGTSKSAGVTSTLKELTYSVYSRSGSIEKRSSRDTLAYRKYREITERQKEKEKYNELEKVRLAVDAYENTLDRIHSIHKKVCNPINWPQVRDSNPPYHKPNGEIGPQEKAALQQLNEYKPKKLTRLLGKYGKELQVLKENVYQSRDKDILEYQTWVRDVRIAAKVIAGDANTYFRIMKEFAPFDDLLEYGHSFTFSAVSSKVMEIEFDAANEKVVPKEQYFLSESDELLTKEMPTYEFFDLQQEYTFSCAIRIAREMFSLLPLDAVYIHAIDTVRDTTAGIEEKKTILSVRFDQDSLSELKFDQIKCSDHLRSINCHINFNHSTGFQEVDRLLVSETEVKSAK